MRIGVDYLPAVTHGPGVGRYARELVGALVRQADPPELCLVELGGGRRSVPAAHLRLAGHERALSRRVRLRLPRRLLSALARGPGVDGLLGGVDVFHHAMPGRLLPVRRARQTLAVSALPAPGSEAERVLARSLAQLDGVFVFSQVYGRTLVERFGVSPEVIVQVPVGADHWLRELAPTGADQGLPLPVDPPEVLVLGATRACRRHAAIVAAVARLVARGRRLRLLVVGGPGHGDGAYHAALGESGLGGHVEREVPVEERLPALVSRASVLVHLNDDEGTPVTPLEALSFGLSVVASRLPAFVEAVGDAAHWVDNDAVDADVEVLARALDAALDDAADPAGRARRRARAAAFTWEACARETVRGWQAIVRCRDR